VTSCLNWSALFAACLLIAAGAAAAEPTVADLQRWLQEARAAKAAADAKVAQVNKQALVIRAERDKVNAEIKDLKAKMASADQAINAAQTELNSGAGQNAEHLKELIAYEKALKIESATGTVAKDQLAKIISEKPAKKGTTAAVPAMPVATTPSASAPAPAEPIEMER
jgi:septal ring factor EnvC (AmiA/AmiB activator)